jgi:hypothetical protein
MSLSIRLENLKRRRKKLAKIAQTLSLINFKDLQLLRLELIKTLHNLHVLIASPGFQEQRYSDDDRRFLNTFRDEVDKLEIEVAGLIRENEQELSQQDRNWGAELLPEPSTRKSTLKYPALASHISPDLMSLMDDSWLPVDRPMDVRPLSIGGTR